jgi:hypothetical protein
MIKLAGFVIDNVMRLLCYYVEPYYSFRYAHNSKIHNHNHANDRI